MDILKDENLKNIFVQIDGFLNSVEVKGNSVEGLFMARRLLTDLYKMIKTIEQEEKIEKEE